MTVIAVIDDEMYDDRTVLLADSIAEVAGCLGNYIAETGAACCPPPPVTADPAGWEEWLAAFIDEDEACPVNVEIYAEQLVLTPRRYTLAQPFTAPRAYREWTAQAGPALRLSRTFDACARTVEDVTVSL